MHIALRDALYDLLATQNRQIFPRLRAAIIRGRVPIRRSNQHLRPALSDAVEG